MANVYPYKRRILHIQQNTYFDVQICTWPEKQLGPKAEHPQQVRFYIEKLVFIYSLFY